MLEWPKDHLYKNYYRLLTLAYGIQAVDECYPFSSELRQLVNEHVEQIESMENDFTIPSIEQEQPISVPSPVEAMEVIPKKKCWYCTCIRCSFMLLAVLAVLVGVYLWVMCSDSMSLVLKKYPVVSSISTTPPTDVCSTVSSFSEYVVEFVSYHKME